ncbi:hypothetical protein H110_01843 [Trichophyton rubrum MR1448]|nr:hypothetical protein H110_01843 [Trichophyton rubrum MR1448]
MIHDCSFGIFMNNNEWRKRVPSRRNKNHDTFYIPISATRWYIYYGIGSAFVEYSRSFHPNSTPDNLYSLASPLTFNQRITSHTIKLANVGAACEQTLADMDTKFPSSCRLCNIPLDSQGAWRQHARSELHIHNLRLRVAEPGSTILPLQSRAKTINPDHDSLSEDDSDETDEDQPWMLEFNPEQCLFCGEARASFDDNILHMSKAHSFIIPYQDHLDADITPLLRYLYFEIFGYHRCILCSTHRRTVEGIQHHMMAKGHCRFDITSHTSGFYNFRQEHHKTKVAGISPLLRLSPVRIYGYRTRVSDKYRQSLGRRDSPQSLLHATEQGSTETEDDKPTSASCTQLLGLSRGDQKGLAHLSNPELRSLLAIRAKHIGQLRRKETNAKLKLEKAGNITLTAHFRADTSKRFRGPWG